MTPTTEKEHTEGWHPGKVEPISLDVSLLLPDGTLIGGGSDDTREFVISFAIMGK